MDSSTPSSMLSGGASVDGPSKWWRMGQQREVLGVGKLGPHSLFTMNWVWKI